MRFNLHYLADRRGDIPVCAEWEHAEWGRGGGKTITEAMASYEGVRRDGVPLTLVACSEAGQAVGMVSLWASDCPLRSELTPWVASLYVAPPARGYGIGTSLFARIEQEAVILGFRRLYLMTQHSAATYAAAGWSAFDRVDGLGALRDAVLMRKDLSP
ncbi:GNAT family N-acetyltransferase [Magnetospirillum sulfuroxidans]|uniref:GNAT family N-acetyltransferase n=1 Tax=Magnetospirillum sulfuroxidans TaxID=611300 RepID=A0ABS5ICH7_9PROT|nr:GNAT family N-acetyltransferase [Magnetospirillum sulfuroxidans]MBR9971388.1 GNAT family N-acetyltransferase [Magnetospirillum sulfuroxidans]